MNYEGFLITFEGNEGSGKTTQLNLLRPKMLEKYGDKVVFSREPGGSRIAEQIRGIILSKENTEITPMCELLLYEAARAQFCSEVLMPALERGKIVVLDRFYDSTYAYQGWGRGISADVIRELNEIAVGPDIEPDLTLWLKVNPEVGNRRRMDDGDANRMDLQGEHFYRSIEAGYRYLSETEKRFIPLQPQSVEDTHAEIWEIVMRRIGSFLRKSRKNIEHKERNIAK